MDKKFLILLAILTLGIGYFIWKKKNSKSEEDVVENTFLEAPPDFKAAEEYKEVEVQTTGLTAEERKTLTPEEQAELEEQREQQLQLDLIRRNYKDLTGANLKAYTVEAAQLEYDNAVKKTELLDQYMRVAKKQGLSILDERYDTAIEIEGLINAANKANEYVDLGGSYAETTGKTAQELDQMILARKSELKSKWDADRVYIEQIRDKFNIYLIKDITYKNKEANIKPIQDFLTKCTNRDRAYFIASVNNSGNVKIKYDSKQHTFKTLAEAIQKMFDNKSFGTHKNAGAFMQKMLGYAKEFNSVKLSDFDIYGKLK